MNTLEKRYRKRLEFIDYGENPFRIPDNDPLLRELLRAHEDRRYESISFPEKIKAKRKPIERGPR